jgi:hypothetical protein
MEPAETIPRSMKELKYAQQPRGAWTGWLAGRLAVVKLEVL